MICISILSCFASLFIILIYITESQFQKKVHCSAIFYLSVSNFLFSLGGSFGLVKDRSILCTAQFLLTNIFPLVGFFWTFYIVFLMYGVYANNRTVKSIGYQTHIISWLTPIILSLLPLTTNRYGTLDEDYGWCFIAPRSSTKEWQTLFWVLMSFYAWIWIAELFFGCFFLYSLYLTRMSHTAPSNSRALLSSLMSYPLISLMCWTLPCYYDTMDSIQKHDGDYVHHSQVLYILSHLLPLTQGALTALAFFLTEPEAHYRAVSGLDTLISRLSCGMYINILGPYIAQLKRPILSTFKEQSDEGGVGEQPSRVLSSDSIGSSTNELGLLKATVAAADRDASMVVC
jgi:hypothetical protein